ncbi:MAG: hypothetical protein Q9186_004206 [Xanthomendoza sp. 1 TL-2023]
MGTRGLKVWRFRKRYFAFYNSHDSNPDIFGRSLVNSIPTDPEQYKQWLEEKRRMVDKWDEQYERCITVSHHINEDDDSEFLLLDDGPDWKNPAAREGQKLPSFIAPLNDLFIEWVYTFNLEQEVFSINNEVHYFFCTIPRDDQWFTMDFDADGNRVILPSTVLDHYLASLAIGDPDGNLDPDKSTRPKRKIIRPKNIGSISPIKRHDLILRTLLFSVFGNTQLEQGLSATLLQWCPKDLAFREFAYTILCLAAGGKHMSMIKQQHIKHQFAYDFLSEDLTFDYARHVEPRIHRPRDEQNPFQEFYSNVGDTRDRPIPAAPESLEFVGHWLSGRHLPGMSGGSSPNSTMYWFAGALVVLTSSLHEASALERGLLQVMHHQEQSHKKTFNAILLSIEHVVLAKIFQGGEIERTCVMPLFNIPHHSSREVNARSPAVPEEELKFDDVEAWRRHTRERKRLEREEALHNNSGPRPTFQALATFFDILAHERLPPARAREGCFPTEIYAVIIENVLHGPTRQACMEVSRTFRHLCSQFSIIGRDVKLEASGMTMNPHEVSEHSLKWSIAGNTLTDVSIGDDKTYLHSDRRKWGNEDLLRILVGSEYNHRSFLPFSIRFRPQGTDAKKPPRR